jgi:putative DNA methylase
MTRALIEEELPLEQVNEQSALEKHLRHGNISTMHLWWARRPLAMSRAVVFASLIPDPDDDMDRQQLLDEIARTASFAVASGDPGRMRLLRDAISKAWPDRRPKVLDCFAGGGAIPLEAARLGCDVTATDINPVAYLIQRCVLEYPAKYGALDNSGARPFVDDFVRWADWVKRQAEERLAAVFPRPSYASARVAAYFWTRTIPCADLNCGRTIPIISSRKLADSSRRRVRVDYDVKPDHIELRVANGAPDDGTDWSTGTKTSRGSSVTVTCPVCSTSRPDKELRAHARAQGFGHYLYGVMEIRDGSRSYREPTPAEIDAADKAIAFLDELDEYPEGTTAAPDEQLVKSQYRTLRPLTYGIDTWAAMFTSRQRYVLAVLAQTARAAHQQMLEAGMDFERAKALATYLGLAVDRIADYNSTFVTWVPSGEFPTHTFPQQSVRMAWDFTEIDPLADGPGNWDGAIDWIKRALDHCCNATAGNPSRVQRANAQELPFADGEFDAVIIDPPYYDAFQYGDLSDFFYVWLKRSIGHLYRDLFLTPLSPKQAEVIENRADKKSSEYISHEEFESRLQNALDEVARVVKDDGIVSLVFAHTNVDAWGRLLKGLRGAGLVVTTSWPMQSERTGRTTANVGSVLGSSVVLVCRKAEAQREGFYDDVVRELEARLEERLSTFEEMQLSGADYFVSAVGPAFEIFARYSRVARLSGEEVDVDQLMVLARQAVAHHAMRRLLGGESLVALDDRSLFYVTWRWAYDGLPIPADEAYMLCRAFDADLDDLTRLDGLVAKQGSGKDLQYRLLGPDDRKKIELGGSPSLVDVLHMACQLQDQGRRNELVELLGLTGAGNEPGFWAMTSAIAEALPEGDRERTLLLGLGGNREALSEAAAKHTGPGEALTLDLQV